MMIHFIVFNLKQLVIQLLNWFLNFFKFYTKKTFKNAMFNPKLIDLFQSCFHIIDLINNK